MKQNFERAFMGALVMTLPGLLIARWLASGAFGLVVITMFFITLGSFLGEEVGILKKGRCQETRG